MKAGNESAPIESAEEVKNMLLVGDFDYDGDVDLLTTTTFFKPTFKPTSCCSLATLTTTAMWTKRLRHFCQTQSSHGYGDGNAMVDLKDFFLWADNLGASLY